LAAAGGASLSAVAEKQSSSISAMPRASHHCTSRALCASGMMQPSGFCRLGTTATARMLS
jgi:hypothetical protein